MSMSIASVSKKFLLTFNVFLDENLKIDENFNINRLPFDKEIFIGNEEDERFIRLSKSIVGKHGPYDSYRTVSFNDRIVGTFLNAKLDYEGITLIFKGNSANIQVARR